jgi:hypothetical protein
LPLTTLNGEETICGITFNVARIAGGEVNRDFARDSSAEFFKEVRRDPLVTELGA